MYNTLSPVLPSVSISATSTSGSVALTGSTFAGAETVLVTNAGASTAFFRLGVGAQTALVTDTPILPYTALVVARASATHAGAITAGSDTATVYFTSAVGG